MDFLRRSAARHGNYYDYSKFIYRGAREKGEIICSEHESFWQAPNNHLRGTKYPTCARKIKYKNHLKPNAKKPALTIGAHLNAVKPECLMSKFSVNHTFAQKGQ